MDLTCKANLSRFFLFLVSLFLLISCGGGGGGGAPVVSLPAQDTAPSFNRSTGYFVDPIVVTVAAPIGGATLRVTEDGSNPTCNSGEVLTTSIDVAVSAVKTVKALFCKDGFSDSAITEATLSPLVADIRVSPAASGQPIQVAIDAATPGQIIFVEPGTYTEDNIGININKKITLIGHGSGTDPVDSTIINIATAANPIFISTVGTSAADPLAVRNLLVTGSIGTGNPGTGLKINTTVGFIEMDNVTVTGNGGYGIAFDVSDGTLRDIVLINSTMSSNGSHGFRVPSSMLNIDGLTIDNCVFENNTHAGAMFYTPSDGGVTNISITNSSFSSNASGIAAYQYADLIFSGFLGNAIVSNVTIDSDGCDSAIRLTGRSDGADAGKTLTSTIALSDIVITGMQQSNGTYPAGAIVITRYDDLSNLSMNNVVLNSTAPHGLFLGTITGTGPDLGNLAFNGDYSGGYDIELGQHGNSSSYVNTSAEIDATGATFLGAASDAEIEARVYHSVDDPDPLMGTVSWTSP